jgi:undecaprenyl diphosphate synthase
MHIGFIMDGNGRWALRNGLTRAEGHEQGIEKANEIMMACVKRKIARATFYAFSVQNWSRDRSEIETIYSAGKALFQRMAPWVKQHNVVVKCVGDKFNLMDKEENPKVRAALELGKALMAETAKNTGTIITLCVSYGGREEILDVFRKIKEPLHTLTTAMVSDFFEIPDVDLVVRTSGEYRISNFLLWQSAYAEYYFTDKMWPEFNELQLDKAIEAYRNRDRRFGTVGARPPLTSPEDLKEIYAELLSSFSTEIHTETDLKALYANLLKNKAHTFSSQSYSKSQFQKTYESISFANPGAIRIFLQLQDLNSAALETLARDFSIETLDHVLQRPTRLDYIDATKEEKLLLETLCHLKSQSKSQTPFLDRISITYYQLKLHLKHMVHDDALTLYAILLAVCEDIVDRKFHQAYFDREDLKTILFQVLRDTLEMEAETNKEIRDLFTYSCLAILFHYFDEPNPAIPKSALELNVWLISKIKEIVADQFTEDYE